MSIVKDRDGKYTVYIPTCDRCGCELREVKHFSDAVQEKKNSGWRSVKTADGWEDLCPDCQGRK